MTLEDLGWNEAFAEGFAPFAERGLIPARLVRETKINFAALLEGGEEIDCVLGGKVWHEALAGWSRLAWLYIMAWHVYVVSILSYVVDIRSPL